MPQIQGWWRSVEIAASRRVRISFKASLDAFSAAPGRFVGGDEMYVRARTLTANWEKGR